MQIKKIYSNLSHEIISFYVIIACVILWFLWKILSIYNVLILYQKKKEKKKPGQPHFLPNFSAMYLLCMYAWLHEYIAANTQFTLIMVYIHV